VSSTIGVCRRAPPGYDRHGPGDVDLGSRQFAGVAAVDEPFQRLGRKEGQGEMVARLEPRRSLLVDQQLVDPTGPRATSFEQDGSVDDPVEPLVDRGHGREVITLKPAGATNMNDAGATASTCGKPAISSKYPGLTSTDASDVWRASSRRGYALSVRRAPATAVSTTAPTSPTSSATRAVSASAASALFDKFEINAVPYIVAVIIFTLAVVLIKPFADRLAGQYARGATWLGGLVATYIVLLLADVLSDGIQIRTSVRGSCRRSSSGREPCSTTWSTRRSSPPPRGASAPAAPRPDCDVRTERLAPVSGTSLRS
jgi:hypothetical protein